ncbi:MAG: hypothetical protein PV362_16785, partial [Providencia heimbachae]|nr:hypothetical protein [Providencia heimbachae]
MDTKRAVLSTIARIYDPIGLISPITISAKLIMQDLWKAKLDWEDWLPSEIQNRWDALKNNLSCLERLSVSRCLFRENPVDIQCHGFSDASLLAYGACIYLRATYEDGSISCHLLCSKSKVAPLKNITLPRLELLGAMLLAKLYRHVFDTFVIKISKTVLWSDSSIVLAWLNTDANQLKMFVGNRVAEILDLTPAVMWRHVSGKDNLADIVSRGVKSPNDLLGNELWWQGPPWLCRESNLWPAKPSFSIEKLPEIKILHTTSNTVNKMTGVSINILLERCSTFNKIVRVLAYCLRWVKRYRVRVAVGSGATLSVAELKFAKDRIFYLTQTESFAKENDGGLTITKQFKPLHPFRDANGLWRVGGRLENAEISYDQKHPVILPKSEKVVELFLKAEHERLLHAGAQTVLANVRLNYWPINGRSL